MVDTPMSRRGDWLKREALRRLIRENDVKNAIIFCNRKRDVDDCKAEECNLPHCAGATALTNSNDGCEYWSAEGHEESTWL